MNKEEHYVVAVAGSGGKTSLIEYLAERVKEMGKRVAVMTTTHMALPRRYSAVGKTPEEAQKVLEREGAVFFGNRTESGDKMCFPGREAYETICRKADLIFVEADGSRRLPMKVPDWKREPVFPANTDAVFVVFGLTAIGRPFGEACQRWELGKEWAESGIFGEVKEEELPNLTVTRELAAEVLIRGYLKPISSRFPDAPLVVFLNQAEAGRRREDGLWMQGQIEKTGVECRVCSLNQPKLSMIYMASGFGKRFGGNKLLAPVGGKRLFEYGLETVLSVKKQLEDEEGVRVSVIVVSRYQEILSFGRKQGAVIVENPDAAEGITASIRLGTKAAPEDTDYYFYAVADQPWLRQSTLLGFFRQFSRLARSDLKSIGCLSCEGKRGNPVIFHKRYRAELLSLKGDRGGRQIMNRYPDEVLEYPAGEKELEDIDSPGDLAQ